MRAQPARAMPASPSSPIRCDCGWITHARCRTGRNDNTPCWTACCTRSQLNASSASVDAPQSESQPRLTVPPVMVNTVSDDPVHCSVALLDQRTRNRTNCTLGVDFGCLRHTIWVRRCRGVFQCAHESVRVSCGYPPGGRDYECACDGRDDWVAQERAAVLGVGGRLSLTMAEEWVERGTGRANWTQRARAAQQREHTVDQIGVHRVLPLASSTRWQRIPRVIHQTARPSFMNLSPRMARAAFQLV